MKPNLFTQLRENWIVLSRIFGGAILFVFLACGSGVLPLSAAGSGDLDIFVPEPPEGETPETWDNTFIQPVNINLTNVNHAPSWSARTETTQVGRPLVLNLNESDPDGHQIVYNFYYGALRGQVAINGSQLTYTPNPGPPGSDYFFYSTKDQLGAMSISVVNVIIGNMNNWPASGTTPDQTTPQGQTLQFHLTGMDPEYKPLSFAVISALAGNLSLAENVVTYTPFSNFWGTEFISYVITDSAGNKSAHVVPVTVQAPAITAVVARVGSPTGPQVGTGPNQYGAIEVHFSLLGLSDGRHDVFFTVTDSAGRSVTGRGRYHVDGTKPVIRWTANTPAEDQFVSKNISFFIHATDDFVKNVKRVWINPPTSNQLEVDLLATSVVDEYAVPSFDTRQLPDGSRGFQGFATDRAHNRSDPLYRTLRIDNSPPNINAQVTPPPVAYSGKSLVRDEIVVNVTGTDAGCGVKRVQLYLENGSTSVHLKTVNGDSLQERFSTSGYSDGSWTLKCISQDVLDNERQSSLNVHIDNTKPSTNILYPVLGARYLSITEVRVDASDANGVKKVDIAINGVVRPTQFQSPNRYIFQTPYSTPGNVRISAIATDEAGNQENREITVVINSPPAAQPLSLSVNEDEARDLFLSGNDVDGDPLTFSIVRQPLQGTLNVAAPHSTSQRRYTPQVNYNGPDSFTFQVYDGFSYSAEATVSIAVAPVNDAPVAVSQNLSGVEDADILFNLQGSDVDGDILSYVIVTPPVHGTLVGNPPALKYQPHANYNGSDGFVFKAKDATLFSPSAAVSITVTPVNDKPIAYDQIVGTYEDSAVNFDLAGMDIEGSPLSFIIVTQPSKGTINRSGASCFYMPGLNQNGTDSFRFKVSDGSKFSEEATVTINIQALNDAPVATSIPPVATPEDTAVSVVLSGSDVDGDPLTFRIVRSPMQGQLSNSAPNLSYLPRANYSGADSFSFVANDGQLDSLPVSVSITVSPVNDDPVAEAQNVSTPEDNNLAVNLRGSDIEGSALTYHILTVASHGILTGSGSSRSYTPNPNYFGPDLFTFKVNDGEKDSPPATISITVSPQNDAPVAVSPEPLTINEDTPTTLVLTGTDVDEDPLKFSVATPPSRGTFVNNRYTPNSHFNGSDSFTFVANDGQFNSPPALVSITIRPVNDEPVATSQSVSTLEDMPVNILLAGSDVEGDPLTYSVVEQPRQGTLSGTPPQVRYTPGADFSGADSFTFKAHDGSEYSSPATVSLLITAVNDPPIADPQSLKVDEDNSLPFTLTGSDKEGSVLVFSLVSQPQHGRLVGNVYHPDLDYNGPDSFSFKAHDGQIDSIPATVSIAVAAVNDAPIAHSQAVSTPENTSRIFSLTGFDKEGSHLSFRIVSPPSRGSLQGAAPNVTYVPALNSLESDQFSFVVNDGEWDSPPALVSIVIDSVNDAPEADNQNLSTLEDTSKAITLSATDKDGDPLTYRVINQPTHGSLSGTVPHLTYTPVANFNGTDQFTFKANDGVTDSNLATIVFNVTPVNDPPLAINQSVSAFEDTPLEVVLTGSDVEGSALTFSLVTPPSHGIYSEGRYTPATNFHGTDSFSFIANDSELNSAPAAVSITITSVNDAPVATPRSLSVQEDSPLSVDLTGTDVDGDALTFEIVTPPLHGVWDGQNYTPHANYNGNDSFLFKARDGQLDSSPAAVAVSMIPVNDAPIATNVSVTTREDSAVTLALSASDVDGDPLTYRVIEGPRKGVLSGTGESRVYTPNQHYNGGDSFTFMVTDGSLESGLATVSITIKSENNPPVAENSQVSTLEDQPLLLTLPATDPDHDPLIFTVVRPPSHGLLTGEGANRTYTPSKDFDGSDDFSFRVNDGVWGSKEATVSVQVMPVDDEPLAHPQSLVLLEDLTLAIVLSGEDVEKKPLTFHLVTGPSHGALTGSEGNLLYSPSANYNGPDSFTFKTNDGVLDSLSATVSLQITPVNDAPLAIASVEKVLEDTPTNLSLIASDADGDQLNFIVVQPPLYGELMGTGGSRTYVPLPNNNQPDQFVFKVNDGTQDSGWATVSIQMVPVNDVPLASPQEINIRKNNSRAIILQGQDVDNDPLVFNIEMSPAHGVLLASNQQPNEWVYTPAKNFVGEDGFTFSVEDGSLKSQPARVGIQVQGGNNTPIALDQTLTTNEDTPLLLTLLATDLDDDALQYILVDAPANGFITGTPPQVTYTPLNNFFGTDVFTFKVNDGSVDSPVGLVRVSIHSVNDPPEVVSFSLEEGAYVTGTVELEARARDDNGIDRLTVQIDQGPELSMIPSGGGLYRYQWRTNLETEVVHTLRCAVQDNEGMVAIKEVRVGVDRQPPIVKNIIPSQGALVSGVVQIGADLGDTMQLGRSYIFIDGNLVTSRSLSGLQSNIGYSWTTGANGEHTINVVVEDRAGNRAEFPTVVTVNNPTGPNTLPRFEVLQPAVNSVVRGVVTLKLKILEGTVDSTGFKVGNGAVLPGVMSSPDIYEALWVTAGSEGVVDGSHDIEFSATNTLGTTKISRSVRVDNTNPHVTLVKPTANSIWYGVQNIQATVSDGNNRLQSVLFRLDAIDVAQFQGNASITENLYAYALDTAQKDPQNNRLYPDGPHILYVIATDEAGNTAQSEVPFHIDNLNIPAPQTALVEEKPLHESFVMTDEESEVSARISNVQIDQDAFARNPQQALQLTVTKDGKTIHPYPGTVQLINGVIYFKGTVPDNSEIHCDLTVEVIEDGQTKKLTYSWDFTRVMNKELGGQLQTDDGILTVLVPPHALKNDSFLSIQLIEQPSNEIVEADSKFENLFGNQKVVYGPFEIVAKDREGKVPTELASPLMLIYARPPQNIPATEESFVDQIQWLQTIWRPLASSNAALPPPQIRNPSGSRIVQVSLPSLGIFRVNSFAVPQEGVSEVFNFPNPFSPSNGGTDIHYLLGADSDVRLVIYDLLGNLVKTIDVSQGSVGGKIGQNILHWDGRNGEGTSVANGGYIVQIHSRSPTGTEARTKIKMAVAK
ncbi:MAG: hypothetical protein KCHDKBKB_02292 [Elusimicrobia bacterium]|nr:hypothetical protein [Elusimicrobiota bacterium]